MPFENYKTYWFLSYARSPAGLVRSPFLKHQEAGKKKKSFLVSTPFACESPTQVLAIRIPSRCISSNCNGRHRRKLLCAQQAFPQQTPDKDYCGEPALQAEGIFLHICGMLATWKPHFTT